MRRPASGGQPPLRVRIGALAIPGVNANQGRRLQSAFVAELTRLLSPPQVLARLQRAASSGELSSRDLVQAGVLSGPLQDRPERTGRRLAQQLSRQLLAARPNRGVAR